MAAGCGECLFDRRHGLNVRGLILLALLCSALPGYGLRVQDKDDRLDASILRIDEAARLGALVPDVEIITEEGPQSLHALIAQRPTILVLSYYSCGHTCPVTIRNLAAIEAEALGVAHQVLVVSFDSADTVATMRGVRESMGAAKANWTFGLLSEDNSRRLTEAVGFKYFFSERDQLYVHPAVLTFLSPEGQIMRYLYGAEPRTDDVSLALLETKRGTATLNEFVDMLKLTCFQFDGRRSRYVLHPTVIFGGAGLGVLGLVGLATLASRKHSRGGQ